MLRLTRWTMAHRRTVLVLWITLAVALLGGSTALGTRSSNNFSLPGTSSQRALDLLKSRFPAHAGDSDQIVFHARAGTLTQPAVRAVVVPLLARVARLPHVSAVVSPYAPGAHAISADGSIAFATVSFNAPAAELPKAAVNRVISTAEAARSRNLQVELGGQAIEQAQQTSLGFATAVGLLAAIVILLIAFGSFAAMGLPILSALLGLGVGLGLIGLAGHVVGLASVASELALLIGLGVGIDYALFIVTRFRDAYRENGGDVPRAIELAMNSAGRAILFAGTTVVIALLGMFLLGVGFLNGMAIAASLGVLSVLAASLTLLPALLSLTGRRVGRTRGRARTRAASDSGSGFWARWVGAIQRRPVIAATAGTVLMLALAAPALGLRLGTSDAGNDPAGHTTRQAYALLAQGFGKGFNGPLLLAVRLPATGQTSALARVRSAVAHAPGVAAVAPAQLNPARDVAAITVYPTTSPQSAQTASLVNELRARVIPPIARATHVSVDIGGSTATGIDFSRVLSSKLPLFVGIVVALSALMLLVVFRSPLIPLQGALMNLLSIGASLGVVQAVFERGWLGGLFGVQPGPIDAFIPVLLFAIVFGLSMDYEVFLVSRIHEQWLERRDSSAAVREGVVRTGRVIAAAAAVMVVVFASFATNPDRVLKLFGVALASAVFLDAIVVRMILLPAVLQLLGRRTWTLPSWLDRRIPHVAIEPPGGEAHGTPVPRPALEGAG
ncbi:MAG TPA: MMPL family transporter [Solirubrobacteraceae bacterium]|nr:MMPL family transporter [Solirubrobacteraceae bacterium]